MSNIEDLEKRIVILENQNKLLCEAVLDAAIGISRKEVMAALKQQTGEELIKQDTPAYLIAAAPDLLEALEKIVKLPKLGRIYEAPQVSKMFGEAVSIAHTAILNATSSAAIAKAKEEE